MMTGSPAFARAGRRWRVRWDSKRREWSGDSPPLNLHDLVGLGATRRHDFDRRALLLADQRARKRRGDGDAALLGIRFGLPDDLPHLFLLGVLVDQRDGRTELDRLARQLRDV